MIPDHFLDWVLLTDRQKKDVVLFSAWAAIAFFTLLALLLFGVFWR